MSGSDFSFFFAWFLASCGFHGSLFLAVYVALRSWHLARRIILS